MMREGDVALSWEPSDRFDEWPTCRGCAHLRGNRCAAFPSGIPFMIVSGQTDHMVPRPGQEHWRATGERRPARDAARRTA
jgi:hypothetical protein